MAIGILAKLYTSSGVSALNAQGQSLSDLYADDYLKLRDFLKLLTLATLTNESGGEPEVVLMVACSQVSSGSKRKKVYMPFGLLAPRPKPEPTVDWEGHELEPGQPPPSQNLKRE